jgi:hypothetical protein
MSALSIVFLAKLLGSLLAGPIVLSRSDIDEDYYDEAPAELEGRSDWLGLFVTDGGSRLDPTRVDFVPRQDGAVTVFRLVTDPPNAELLFSDVRPLSAGTVTTVVRWPVAEPPQYKAEAIRARPVRLRVRRTALRHPLGRRPRSRWKTRSTRDVQLQIQLLSTSAVPFLLLPTRGSCFRGGAVRTVCPIE